MIRRSPTEVPLRQEDVAEFVARMQEKKAASSTTPEATNTKDQHALGAEKAPAKKEAVNMIEVNRETRTGMSRESRIGM
jgi:hypothetical protein